MAINLGKNFKLLAQRAGVDATTPGTTTLFTVPPGKTLVGIMVIARVTSAGATSPAAARVNTSAPGDLFPNVTMTNVLALGSKWVFTEMDKSLQVNAAGNVDFEITSGATGGAQLLEVDLLGLLL